MFAGLANIRHKHFFFIVFYFYQSLNLLEFNNNMLLRMLCPREALNPNCSANEFVFKVFSYLE